MRSRADRAKRRLGYSVRRPTSVFGLLLFLLLALLPATVVGALLSALVGGITLELPLPAQPAQSAKAAPPPPTPRPTPRPTPDWPLPDGHFFTQGSGSDRSSGFAVQDRDGIWFWSAFRQLGGPDQLGYPISRRFSWRGFTLQAFERVVLQGQPGGEVQLVNLMDELSAAGMDRWLRDRYGIPAPVSDPPGRSFEEVFAARLELLDSDAAIKAFWERTPDPVRLYGLPTSAAEAGGASATLRTQRTALRHWTSGAEAGQVAPLPAGRIAAQAALFPPEPFEPEPAPS